MRDADWLEMIEAEYELRAPRNDQEWRSFHEIRRKVLFENRGNLHSYDENHPDDTKAGNYPLILISVVTETVIGVLRVDIDDAVAWLRRVAVRDDLQRMGHGRMLIRLAEAFAIGEGCTEVRTNVAADAVGFYERCGYVRDTSTVAANSVPMWKALSGD